MRKVQKKFVEKRRKAHFMLNNSFFFRKYEIMKKRYSTARKAIDDNMMHAHLTLGTYGNQNRLSEYVILFVFPLQQWLHERATTLRYMYTACLVTLENHKSRSRKSSRSFSRGPVSTAFC
jgi:hypothetical protein